jgi:DNA-directed RNA polymerase subunit RPC12/RpoP
MKKSKSKKSAKKPGINSLVQALSKNLDKMALSPNVGSLKDGKDYVCIYCNQPVQPCQSDPSAMCDQMLRSDTEGKFLEQALENPARAKYGVCGICGQPLTKKQLKKSPDSELCPECSTPPSKVSH